MSNGLIGAFYKYQDGHGVFEYIDEAQFETDLCVVLKCIHYGDLHVVTMKNFILKFVQVDPKDLP